MTWFSAPMRLAILVEGRDESTSQDTVVHIFRADDQDSAFGRALELGRSHENEYSNGDGERVRWRFDRVLTVDALSAEGLDGAEVYSALSDPEPGLTFDTEFRPETHQPGRSGI